MHELGIVFHVIKSVEKIGEENGLTNVASVTLELGDPARTRKLLELGSQEDRAFTGGRAQDRDHPRRYVLRGLRARLSHGAVWPHLPALRQRKNVAQAGQRDQLKGD